MKKYSVTIRATVTKTYVVEAENEELAVQEAHHFFTVMPDNNEERYSEDCINVVCDDI